MEYLIAVLAASITGNVLVTIMYYTVRQRLRAAQEDARFWFEKAVGPDTLEAEHSDVRI